MECLSVQKERKRSARRVTIQLDIGHGRSANRKVSVTIAPSELSTAILSIAYAAERNRSGYYMRRHPKVGDLASGIRVGPNAPLCHGAEPKRLTIAQHLRSMKRPSVAGQDGLDSFDLQRAQIVVPVSDVTANLLRPCYSREGLGQWRTFFLEDEPIDRKTYWAVCLFEEENGIREIKFMDLSFDVGSDTVRSIDGRDLSTQGLEWAVALVPLVKHGAPVTVADIAMADYDLRQVFGRTSEWEIRWVYEGWYDKWEERIAELVAEHQERRREFEVFYHSILALDGSGAIQILQVDATLPQLAEDLARAGTVSAGLLDSGGSCALFDPWLQGYLNHGWYFREARGAVLCFELRAMERLPKSAASAWFRGSS
jgi:hypothetical protein